MKDFLLNLQLKLEKKEETVQTIILFIGKSLSSESTSTTSANVESGKKEF